MTGVSYIGLLFFMKRYQLLLYYIEKIVAKKIDYIVGTENKHVKCV